MSQPKKPQVLALVTEMTQVFVPIGKPVVPCPSCNARVVRVEIEHFNEDGHHYENVVVTIEPGGELAIYDDEPGIWRPRHLCGSAMPRLSIGLVHQHHPSYCQVCGQRGEAARQLTRWEEHDEQDQREPLQARRVVVLCQACAKKIIDPHPRLYREMELYEAHPGSMDICIQCVHRRGVSCLKARTGQVPKMRQKRTPMFFDYRGAGSRRAGHMERMAFEWPTCEERREKIQKEEETDGAN